MIKRAVASTVLGGLLLVGIPQAAFAEGREKSRRVENHDSRGGEKGSKDHREKGEGNHPENHGANHNGEGNRENHGANHGGEGNHGADHGGEGNHREDHGGNRGGHDRSQV